MPKIQRDAPKRLVRTSLKSCKRLSHKKHAPTSSIFVGDSSRHFPTLEVLEKLNYKYEIMPDFHEKGNCFFLQDKFMSDFYDCYPEYVCFDILCEVPDTDYSVILLISLDTNGHCEIVSFGLIKSESMEGYAWFFETFKKCNKNWNKIQLISCVHNIGIRDMLLEAFPDKHLYFSFFHSLKSFKKDLFGFVPMLNYTDISKALQIFEQMFFISTETGYAELLKQLKQLSPHIFNLFKKNWHSKKELWTIGLQFDSRAFLKSFNLFLLRIRKSKSLISSAEMLPYLIEKLHVMVLKHRSQFFQQFTSMFQPPLSAYHSRVHVIKKYSKYLTPYAAELVIEQLNKAENLKNVLKVDQYTYKINGIQTVVSFTTCSCNFHVLMLLPCCHIFAVRSYLSIPLFTDSLRQSWVAAKYEYVFLDLYSSFVSNAGDLQTVAQTNKFYEIVNLSRDFWYLSLHCSDEISQQRLDLFRSVLKAWKSNFKINIVISQKQTQDNVAEGFENVSTDYFKDMYGISLNDILDSENEFSSFSLCSENENEFL